MYIAIHISLLFIILAEFLFSRGLSHGDRRALELGEGDPCLPMTAGRHQPLVQITYTVAFALFKFEVDVRLPQVFGVSEKGLLDSEFEDGSRARVVR